MSEHRKELIYDDLEPRPGRSPQCNLFPKVMQHYMVLPPNCPKRVKMYGVVTAGNRSGNRSPVPDVYFKPPLAKQAGPSPRKIRDRNAVRMLTRSLD